MAALKEQGEIIVKINSRILEPAELKKLDKLEKEQIHQQAANNKDIRVQLNDQLKCLDGRLETQQSMVSELQDIFRRRAEIEASYSRDLEALAKHVNKRHKEQKQRRDGWSTFSSLQLWDLLVDQTKKSSRDHSALSEIYSNHMLQRFTQINEDLQRIYKKCRDIGYEIHEEVLKVLHELHTAMKTLHTYQSEFRQAESRFQEVEKSRVKMEKSIAPDKRAKSRKYKTMEKEFAKRKQKCDDAKIKATKARNEYLLYMHAANSSIRKYFVDDLSDLIDCMDFGFHQSLYRTVMMHSDGLDHVKQSLHTDMSALEKTLATLDSKNDKQQFLKRHTTAFKVPPKFEPKPVRRDETESPVVVNKDVLVELNQRRGNMKERLNQMNAESEEIWKSMESAERNLSEVVNARDWDTTRFFVEEDISSTKEPESIVQKEKEKRLEVEDFYVKKFREYVLNSNRIARLQAKHNHISKVVGSGGDQSNQLSGESGQLTMTRKTQSHRRRRIGKTPGKQLKLFGGSLEEYMEETNCDIPPVIKSCVRVINRYGLHHHGMFRKNGAQVEINNFRDAFEKGEDPLADVTDASDINSVAGVMKLYLRELREPLFHIQYFDHFMELAQLESKHEFVVKVRELVNSWPRPIFVVLRYLFAFLNHLSEFSDENMMDPYNLAICFGPTLVPIPPDRDQVQFQNLVNELIKNFIIFHEDIFKGRVAGTVYEKYLTPEPEEVLGDSPLDANNPEFIDSEVGEDDAEDSVFTENEEKEDQDLSIELFGKSETMEAQALYDFNARSSREVNFRKGETILLEKQVSNDWWKGSVNGKHGLIPDKYIMLKMSGEDDRERSESFRSLETTTTTSGGIHSVASGFASSHHGHPEVERSISFDHDADARRRRQSRGSSSSDLASSSGGHTTSASTRHSTQPSPSPSRRKSSSSSKPPPPSVSENQRVSRSSVASTRSSVTSKSMSTSSASGQPQMHQPSPASGKNTNSVISDQDIDDVLQGGVASSAASTTGSSSGGGGTGANTHIIRVSGPVTNLDDTVVSAAAAAAATGHNNNAPPPMTREGSVLSARSRLPVSPSIEIHLREKSSATTSSTDSLLSSGSNQELRTQLDSELAHVDALTTEVEHLSRSSSAAPTTPPPKPRRVSKTLSNTPTTETSAANNNSVKGTTEVGGARSRRHTPGRQMSHEDKRNNNSPPAVAPRTLPRPSNTGGQTSKQTAPSTGVRLKQSSWASRDGGGTVASSLCHTVHDDSVESGIDFRKASNITIGHVTTHHDHVDDNDDDTSFSAKAARDLWERRTSFQSPAASRKSVTTQPGNNHPKLPTAVPTALTDNQSVTNEGGNGNPNPRAFWEQREQRTMKHTPDLIADCTPGDASETHPLSTSPKNSKGTAAAAATATVKAVPAQVTVVASVPPLPRPRTNAPPAATSGTAVVAPASSAHLKQDKSGGPGLDRGAPRVPNRKSLDQQPSAAASSRKE